MTPEQLRKRIFYKEAKPLVDRATVKKMTRRDTTKVEFNDEHPNSEFETFFDFEEDISSLKPAAEQFFETQEEGGDSFVIMEENDIDHSVVFLEKIDETDIINTNNDATNDNRSSVILEELEEEVEGLDFSKCEFLTGNGNSCNNKKSSGSIYCTMHKNKLIEKIKESKKG